jgi:hypothetical protein
MLGLMVTKWKMTLSGFYNLDEFFLLNSHYCIGMNYGVDKKGKS